jgi:exodeoxyribonuclease V alpha subunit
MEELRGTVTRFKFKAEASAFKIADFRPEDPAKGALVTVKGEIDQSNLDMSVSLHGSWVDDPSWGRQFIVKSCIRNQPATREALLKWLSGQKGIGPKTVELVGETFSGDLRTLFEKDWKKLAEVRRVSMTTAAGINQSWLEDAPVREIQLLLMQGGIPATETIARKVVRKLGSNAVGKVSDNPYKLTSIPGIGFKTADTMARQLGWSLQRPERIEAAGAYLLDEAAKEGHSFLHRGELIAKIQNLAAVEVEGKTELLPEVDAVEAIDRVVRRGDVVQERVTIDGQENFLCYLPYYHELEVAAAKRIDELLSYPQVPPNNIDKVLKKVEKRLSLELSAQQRDAVVQALAHNCSVITGLPGTGKTSTCRALIQTSVALGLQTLVAAPTGRAAKRLQEVTGYEAKTIHRTLMYNPKLNEFDYNEKNPLPCGMLIVDESSMLNLELMVAVLKAVPDSCSVVWIGDVNQLPSIGAGMVLRDLIASRKVHTTVLDKIFRQAEGSLIIQNAHRIFRGETPKFPEKGTEADSYWIKVPKGISEASGRETDDLAFVKKMLPQIYQRLELKFKFDPIKDVQVLMPMRVGQAGAQAFNEIIQGIVNPDGERFEISGQVFRIGDRVMQMYNDYDLDIFNGDVGFIDGIDTEGKTLQIEFFERTVQYPFASIANLSLSYASSVHKSQGSEYKVVILLLLSHHFVMLDRNIIYTANTRARKMAIYLASRGAIETAVNTQKVLKRNSLLALRLRALINKREAMIAA